MINTELFQQTMQDILVKLDAEKTILQREKLPLEGASKTEDLDTMIEKASDRSFHLLIMGRFSSGKSACVNVLLGERILAEGAVPTTALITEIEYGEEKQVTMYPRKGKWADGDDPFKIEPTLSEIKKFSTLSAKNGINTMEANRIDSTFEKMVIEWPLEMLKDGVSIVDSPGTNDPYANDYIVEAYVPKADAIIYCIPANVAYDSADKNTLERINARGFANPIIITTYYDVVTEDMDEEEKLEFQKEVFKNYSRHTTWENCHFVNSRLGMRAKEKKKGSQEDYRESGYEELETFLGRYLTENKGREKVGALTAGVRSYNNTQLGLIQDILTNLDLPEADFQSRIAQAEAHLEKAKLQGKLLLSEFSRKAEKAQEEIAEIIPELYDKIYGSISLDGFEPDTNFKVWKPKNSSQQIAEECSAELKRRNEEAVSEWNDEVLQPKITSSLEGISADLQDQTAYFSQLIDEARIEIGSGPDTVETGVRTGTRVAMIMYGLLTGDWMNALMGGVFGAGAFARTAVCEFAAGFIIGIVALFTPVGLPALVIASLGAVIIGGGWNASTASKSIRKKTVSQAKESLQEKKNQIIESVQAQCTDIFVKAEAELRKAIDADTGEISSNIRLIREERKENAKKADKRRRELGYVAEYLKDVNDQMDEIRGKFEL